MSGTLRRPQGKAAADRAMTIRILSYVPNSETRNAELFRDALLASEPRLGHPDITAEIVCGLSLPDRQLDLVLMYHDPRPASLQLTTSSGAPIHSFVLVVEVKNHSPDLVRFEGPRVLVRYDQAWSDATHQCEEQMYALKRYQRGAYSGSKRRDSTFVQQAIWLARSSSDAFSGIPSQSSVPVHFVGLTWHNLIDRFTANSRQQGSIQTLVDHADPKRHSLATLRDLLMYEVRPTRLDLRRVNALTQMRFDTEKTDYIQKLGTGLLVLRGRGGTGKTFALLQIALHLAREGKRSVVLTYNHGLIADIRRALGVIQQEHGPTYVLPDLMTRYEFIKREFIGRFGHRAEKVVINNIGDIGKREDLRLAALLEPRPFLDEPIPGQGLHEAERGNGGTEPTIRWKDICDEDPVASPLWDYAFIDEGQDWTERQRDLVYKLFSPSNVVVADGVDQFVSEGRCQWDVDGIKINRRHGLRASRRTKSATCQTVAEVAREVQLAEWDLEPDPDAHGGRFTVLIERDPRRALVRGLEILEEDQRDDGALKSVDNLICLPSVKMTKGVNYPALFDQAIETRSRDSWRGFDEEDRRIFPRRESQLRAVQYNSCRGMEGWSTLCIGLDQFYDHQIANPHLEITKIERALRAEASLLYHDELVFAKELRKRLARDAQAFATNWLMIPLTRSIDHLIIHICDGQSALAAILRRVSDRCPGAIEWISDETPPLEDAR